MATDTPNGLPELTGVDMGDDEDDEEDKDKNKDKGGDTA